MKNTKKLSAKPTKKTAAKTTTKAAPKKTTPPPPAQSPSPTPQEKVETPAPAPTPTPAPIQTSSPHPPSPSPPPEQPDQNTQNVNQSKPIESTQQINNQQPQEKSYQTISYDPSAVSSFYDLENFELEEYNLKDVPFLTFDGIENLSNASSIFITNALFTSFNHTTKMPKLKKCSFAGSPIYFKTHYRLMILLAFGEQVEEIDNTPVLNIEKHIFNHFSKEIIELLSDYVHKGGIIMQNIDENFIEGLKQKQGPLPQFDIPVKQVPLKNIYYTPFLTKSDIDQFLFKETSENEKNLKESDETSDEKEQRNLISTIENEIFDSQSQNKLSSSSTFYKVFDQNEIKKAEDTAFNFINEALNKILNQLKDSKQQLPKIEGDNIFTSWIYQPILNIFEEAEEKTNSLLSSLKSKSASFSFISRSSIGYQTIFKKNNGFALIINFIRERYYQIKCILNTYYYISIPEELHEIEDKQILSLFREDLGSNLPKLIEAINSLEDQEKKKKLLDDKIIEKVEIQLKAKLIADNTAKSLKKGSVYIALIEKCPSSRYFSSFASICHSSAEIYNNIPDTIKNRNKNEALQLFSELENFSNYVSREFNQILNAIQSIPKYANFKSAIDQSICEARNYLRNFEVEKVELLKEKVQKYWKEGNEFQQERKQIAEKVDKMLQFIIDSNNYQYNIDTPFLVNDLAAFAEEFVVSKDPVQRKQIQDQLDRLDEESDNKDKEIQELLAQCAELGINV